MIYLDKLFKNFESNKTFSLSHPELDEMSSICSKTEN